VRGEENHGGRPRRHSAQQPPSIFCPSCPGSKGQWGFIMQNNVTDFKHYYKTTMKEQFESQLNLRKVMMKKT
jgi:hypothetical protein